MVNVFVEADGEESGADDEREDDESDADRRDPAGLGFEKISGDGVEDVDCDENEGDCDVHYRKVCV